MVDGASRGQQDPAGGEPEVDHDASGWERRFEADVARVDELVELYTSLGYEVSTRGLLPEAFAPECAGCALTACARYVEIYTREPPRRG